MARYIGGSPLETPIAASDLTADAVFQPRRQQWESEPVADKHVVAAEPARPAEGAPTEG
jgi:hypothetical protein